MCSREMQRALTSGTARCNSVWSCSDGRTGSSQPCHSERRRRHAQTAAARQSAPPVRISPSASAWEGHAYTQRWQAKTCSDSSRHTERTTCAAVHVSVFLSAVTQQRQSPWPRHCGVVSLASPPWWLSILLGLSMLRPVACSLAEGEC